ncbi:MAG TPA: hypothetical protein VGV88_10350 [Candidatus Dormibacteraeota bacterium]|nr:hypothetical protein [Candidatus Dormibacteraeota bacterium]
MALSGHPWLDAPVGATRRVGVGWLGTAPARARGLLDSFDALASDGFDPAAVSEEVRRFYTDTSMYRMDLWARWSFFAGAGARAIRAMHAEHLDQLRVPIDVMEAATGVTSDVFEIDGESAWLRRYHDSQRVIYAGVYSVFRLDGQPSLVRVAFPLPNGHCIVLLRPENGENGALRLVSKGHRFGEPGMYLTIARGGGEVSARRTPIAELFTVYPGTGGELRTDHVLWFYRYRMARLHYRIERKSAGD